MNSTPRYQQQATSTAMNTGSARTSIVTTTETCDSDELLRRKSIPSQRKDIHITASKDRLTPWLLYSIRLAVSGSSRSCVWSWREYYMSPMPLPLYCVYDGQTLSTFTSLSHRLYNIINHVRKSRPTWHPQGPSRLGNLHRYNIRGSQPHPIRFT